MINWLINILFLLWFEFSPSSFLFSSMGGFGIGECDDVHVNVKIHLMIDKKEWWFYQRIELFEMNSREWLKINVCYFVVYVRFGVGMEEWGWEYDLFISVVARFGVGINRGVRVRAPLFLLLPNRKVKEEWEVSLHIKTVT